MSSIYPQAPGISTTRTASHRALFLQRSETFLAQGRYIAGATSRDPGNGTDIAVLRIGLLMGKISTVVNSLGNVGQYAPTIIDVLSQAIAIGATSLTLSVAGATELVRRIGTSGTFTLTGPSVANGTVKNEVVTYSAVNLTTGVVTCTATVNAYVAGAFVGSTDGSQIPTTFIPDTTSGFGVLVTDVDGNSVASVDFPGLPVSGIVISSQLLPVWPSDTSLRQWIIARLNDAFGGQFVFDSGY